MRLRQIFIGPRTPRVMLRKLNRLLGWRVVTPSNDNLPGLVA